MKRLAIFVEGYTEQKFVEILAAQIFAANHCAIHIKSLTGGTTVPLTAIVDIPPSQPISNAKYYLLIYNCNGDRNVASYIRDQRTSLIKSGYDRIIGLLDLFPKARTDEEKFLNGLYYKHPQANLHTTFILSVMEIEAWFLSESSHFQRISAAITVALIVSKLGFNPETEDMTLRRHPAQDLDDIYHLDGKKYAKEVKIIDRTIKVLDFVNFYMELQNKIPELKQLIDEIETVFN